MNHADFERELKPENQLKNPDESYTQKYLNHVWCSCCFKLVCVDDRFSKPFKWYLGQNASHNFICINARVIKYCSCVMKKHYNKNLLWIKKIKKILISLENVESVIILLLKVMLK